MRGSRCCPLGRDRGTIHLTGSGWQRLSHAIRVAAILGVAVGAGGATTDCRVLVPLHVVGTVAFMPATTARPVVPSVRGAGGLGGSWMEVQAGGQVVTHGLTIGWQVDRSTGRKGGASRMRGMHRSALNRSSTPNRMSVTYGPT